MPRQARQISESAIYHVMMRGINRDMIFVEEADLQRFTELLAIVRQASGCFVLAYCLMPNHVHLVLQTADEPIGTVVKRLGVRYASWFNRKYGRTGHLFQDRFKSLPVEDDAYLTTLLRYVWNNPVEAGFTTRAEDYRWSSRRHLGVGSPALDDERLRMLVPPEILAEIAIADETPTPTEPAVPGRPPRYSDRAAAELLCQASGASVVAEFGQLDVLTRSRALRELRTRGVPYRQIARITGMSPSMVRRIQITPATVEKGAQRQADIHLSEGLPTS